MDFIMGPIRAIFWAIVQVALSLADGVYKVTQSLVTLDITSFKELWDFWSLLTGFVSVFIIIRVGSMWLKYSTDEDYQEKMQAGKVLARVVPVCIAIALLPIGIKGAGYVSTKLTSNMSLFVSGKSQQEPSSIILTTMNDKKDASGNYIELKLSDIEINLKENDKYKNYNELSDLFLIILIGCIAAFGFLMNALQVGKRFWSLGVKVLIAPIPVSGLINPDDDSFKTWIRMMTADLITNFVQFQMLYFIMIVATLPIIRKTGLWGTIIMFLSAILALLSGVPELARLIGGDTSTGGTLQQIASLRQATAGVGSFVGGTVGGALGAVGGSMLTGGAGAAFGLGKLAGGQSLAHMAGSAVGGAASSMFSGSGVNPDVSGFKGASNVGQAGGQNDAEKRQAMQGFDPSVSSNGASSSSSTDSSTQSSSNGSYQQQQNTSSQEGFEGATSSQTSYGEDSYAKPGSFADKVANYGYQNKGFRATATRMATYGGRHVYQASANRLNQSKPMKVAKQLKKYSSVPEHTKKASEGVNNHEL